MEKIKTKWIAGTANILVAMMLCSCYVVGCGGSSTASGLNPEPIHNDVAQPFSIDLRVPSGTSSEFLPEQLGADFASDLPVSKCDVSSDAAVFSSTWTGDGTNTSADAAYAIYALDLDAASPSAELSLSWNGEAPVGDCWVGLTNWNTNTWQWEILYASSKVYIASPADYANAGNHTFAAVVVLGTSVAQLDLIGFGSVEPSVTYPIVDTNQSNVYDDSGNVINPGMGQAYYGQDGQYAGNQPDYTDNGNGTITDNVTGLMWAQTPNNLDKVTFAAAFPYADGLVLGGHEDWRVPTIKELYSLIDFTGNTGTSAAENIPFLDTDYFDFELGDESAGERHIDAQYWSSTEYVSTTMGGDATTFGVNFADGRIKGYGQVHPVNGDSKQFIRCVRGNTDYGVNSFVDNLDGTVTDGATGLTWMEVDSGSFNVGPRGDGTLNWEEALEWAEGLDYAGNDDWRLPNAKELQSLIDYTRSPATTGSPAIDPLFDCTSIIDEGGSTDWAHYWSSTTHMDGPPDLAGKNAAYLSFGEGQGFMEQPPNSGNYFFMDVHGAGCQRSDPKDGNPDDYPNGHGPQGDVIRIFNLVRCVRN